MMSQETSYAAAIREEVGLRASVSRLVNATLCQYVGGHQPGECLELCPVPCWGWVLDSLQRAPPHFSGPPRCFAHSIVPQENVTVLLEVTLRPSGHGPLPF